MALFNELKCKAIYTIESSFCGNDTGPYKNYHFSTGNLMQMGRDFCRALILQLPISVPQTITNTLQQNISDIYKHYKMLIDTGYCNDENVSEDIRAMKEYFERIDRVRQSGKEIQTKHIKKGLQAVFRETADVFISDGNFSSSVGSEQAPSEDNLDIEIIEKVVPVSEDPELSLKLQKQQEEKKLEEEKRVESPLKRKSTFMADKQKKLKPANMVPRTSNISPLKKKHKDPQQMPSKVEENLEDADDETIPN